MSTDVPREPDIIALEERAKELACLYEVDEALAAPDASLASVAQHVVDALPTGMQHPEATRAELVLDDVHVDSTPGALPPSPRDELRAPIRAAKTRVGHIAVAYTKTFPVKDEGPFLKEERRLLDAIAERLGLWFFQRRLQTAHADWRSSTADLEPTTDEWSVIMSFLRHTDQGLLARLTRKMINYLCWAGAAEADALLHELLAGGPPEVADDNRPMRRQKLRDLSPLADKAFAIAARHCSQEELLTHIRAWMVEEKAGYLIDTLESRKSSLPDIAAALERFAGSELSEEDLPTALQRSMRVSLLRRFFTDDITLIRTTKDLVRVEDFDELCSRLISSSSSHGRLGGKSTGLFQARRVLARAAERDGMADAVAVPKTWYIASDALLDFLRYNNLEDIYDRKYTELSLIRQDYPQIVQLFKSSRFPPSISNGLAAALRDLGEGPLIVRSSSLLEDQAGSTFAGKYKSLFVPNQGTLKQRLEALEDAIAEVYASVFGPDPIEYRAERGLLDVHEEMAIMIQEVVGRRAGRYFLPAYAGVAFSRSSYKWSPRLKPEDGLLRLVPGLGTRAVDRLSNDYPILIAPGRPELRTNVSRDEVLRYSPRYVDVIDLEEGGFTTVEVQDLLREVGGAVPRARDLVDIVEPDRIRRPMGKLEPRWDSDEVVVTFSGLLEDGETVARVQWMLDALKEALGHEIDIEIASDGERLHLLQCRALGGLHDAAPDRIPRDVPPEAVIWSANRHVVNGRVPDLSHLVYVDPERYGALESPDRMRLVGRAIRRLNKVLPKRRFGLIGPGRWGSRGDVRLGVPVTYSDINNTALLVEVARRRGNYVPELSFGTHFFLDLVEARIRYLPLYPDEPGQRFNEAFFRYAKNHFPELVPELAELADVVRVVDVPQQTGGRVVRVLANAEIGRAIALLARPRPTEDRVDWQDQYLEEHPENHWQWRLRMAEQIGRDLDPERFGVHALYVFGSVKNANAGPASDLDLIVHVDGDEAHEAALALWLEGWSRALAEINYLRTGCRVEGLLDVHYLRDADLEAGTPLAARVRAVTDPARRLPLGGEGGP